jgi:hypothetical protein
MDKQRSGESAGSNASAAWSDSQRDGSRFFQWPRSPASKSLIPALSLPDPDDRHVLAAALHARAELILKGFPDGRLDPA